MTVVFINYRRADSSGHARLLYERLSRQPGLDVFMDVDDIPPGADFVEEVERALDRCDVTLSLIGPHWLTEIDRRGRRRLDLASDHVRIELEVALRRGVRLVPILVGGAEMPEPEELPEPLAPLVRRNAVTLRDDASWADDVQRLCQALLRLSATPDEPIAPEAERVGDPVVGSLQPSPAAGPASSGTDVASDPIAAALEGVDPPPPVRPPPIRDAGSSSGAAWFRERRRAVLAAGAVALAGLALAGWLAGRDDSSPTTAAASTGTVSAGVPVTVASNPAAASTNGTFLPTASFEPDARLTKTLFSDPLTTASPNPWSVNADTPGLCGRQLTEQGMEIAYNGTAGVICLEFMAFERDLLVLPDAAIEVSATWTTRPETSPAGSQYALTLVCYYQDAAKSEYAAKISAGGFVELLRRADFSQPARDVFLGSGVVPGINLSRGDHRARLECARDGGGGVRLRLFVDGTPLIERTDPRGLPPGGLGFGIGLLQTSGRVAAHFNDLDVTAPETAATGTTATS
ncbi:MAG: hypothetical protein QOE98_2744 [Gaiellaceae bacterium]|nr:hypothetical protein [Gaiellaceae bacterium]